MSSNSTAARTAAWETVFGSDLREGDVIKTWFSEGRDRIVRLASYTGPLEYLFQPEGAQIATFALNRTGMTIENGALFERAITAAKGGA